MRQAGFLFIFFMSQKTDEATFFKSEKDRWGAFETDEGGPGKQLTFFSCLIEILKKVLSSTHNVLMSTVSYVTVLK